MYQTEGVLNKGGDDVRISAHIDRQQSAQATPGVCMTEVGCTGAYFHPAISDGYPMSGLRPER
jgi:hypothetical protein